MGLALDVVGESGLKFYGKMCAALTHEMKNALAIINENVGLLQDYNLMAQRGTPLTPERFSVLSQRMVEQVDRANGLLQVMNRFSHGVDEFVTQVDLKELLLFVAKLSERFASVKGISVEVQPGAHKAVVTSSPFLLQNLVWLCIDFAMDNMESGSVLKLTADLTPEGARLTFSTPGDLSAAITEFCPEFCESALLDVLQAGIETGMQPGDLVLTIPERIDQ